jgi:Na+/citrate or Na+/malate symporter
MFKFMERRPFLSGFITGFVGVGIVGRNIKKLIKSKITIIQIDLKDIPTGLTFGETPQPSGEQSPKSEEEN